MSEEKVRNTDPKRDGATETAGETDDAPSRQGEGGSDRGRERETHRRQAARFVVAVDHSHGINTTFVASRRSKSA